MKECAGIREQLSAYLDKVLAPGEVSAVEEHIKECRSCAAALDDLRKVVGHLHELEQVDPPPWFTQKVMTRVREAGAGEKKGLFAWLAAPMYIKLPVGALATVALAVTTYFVLHGVIQEMPVEREKQGQEVSSPAPVTAAPARAEKPSKPATERQAVKADAMRAKAIEPAARPAERAMKYEAPVRSAKSVAIPETDSGYAPAPPVEYKASTPAPSRAPDLRAGTSAPAAQYERKYDQAGSVMKSKKAMAASGYSTASRDMAAKASEGEYRGARQERLLMAENVPVAFHLTAANPSDAGRKVADALRQFNGKNIRTEPGEGRLTVKAELQVNFVGPLYEKLKLIGKVREQRAPQFTDVNSLAVAVEIAEAK
jgi:hypothetical protein